MADKITLPTISSGSASVAQLNEALDAIENHLNNYVLYRNNPVTGAPNTMSQDFDMNGYDILNCNGVYVNGTNILTEMQTIYTNYLILVTNVTISTDAPSGGNDGDIWFKVSA